MRVSEVRPQLFSRDSNLKKGSSRKYLLKAVIGCREWGLLFLLRVIDKLSSKLHKNENNTDILLWFELFTKITWKYFKIPYYKFIKKLLLASTTASRRIQKIMQAFPTVYSFELANAAIIFCFQIIGVAQSFVGLLLNCSPHIIIKGIAVWKVSLSDFRDDVIAEMFSLASDCIAWHINLLPDEEPSSSPTLNLGQYYLLRVLDVSPLIWGQVGGSIEV